MNRNYLFKCFFSLFLILMTARSFAAPGDIYFVDQNHPNASDSNTGSEIEPWLTIQKAASTLKAGETVKVKAGVYTELSGGSGAYIGLIPASSGAADNRITYEAFTEGDVIIDQAGKGFGFYLVNRHYITIKGFEIRNAYSGGVRTEDQSSNSNIIIENNHIHGIRGPWGHNVGGVRLDSCSYCTVRNNVIYDIKISADPQTNSAGIHSYRMSNSVIENNDISDSYNGIFYKQAPFDGSKSAIIRRNIIHNIKEGIRLTPQGAGYPGHQDLEIYENIFYEFGRGIYSHLQEASTAANGLKLHNNVFAEGVGYGGAPEPECMVIGGFRGVEIWDNICHDVTHAIITEYIPDGNNHFADITFIDYNIFSNSDQFRSGRYGGYLSPVQLDTRYYNLFDWQSNGGNTHTISASNLDKNSINSNPKFVSEFDRNYRLAADSPGRGQGRYGNNIGAYTTDAVIIGAGFEVKSPPKPPAFVAGQ